MDGPLSRLLTRVAYGAGQLPRVAWYVGHSLAVRQLSEATRRQEGKKARRRPRTDLPVPGRNQIYADMAELFMHPPRQQPRRCNQHFPISRIATEDTAHGL
jgi:hypothetical protein